MLGQPHSNNLRGFFIVPSTSYSVNLPPPAGEKSPLFFRCFRAMAGSAKTLALGEFLNKLFDAIGPLYLEAFCLRVDVIVFEVFPRPAADAGAEQFVH